MRTLICLLILLIRVSAYAQSYQGASYGQALFAIPTYEGQVSYSGSSYDLGEITTATTCLTCDQCNVIPSPGVSLSQQEIHLQASRIDFSTVDLSWQISEFEPGTQLRLERRPESDSSFEKLTLEEAFTVNEAFAWQDHTAPAGRVYYRISWIDPGGMTGFSATVEVGPHLGIPRLKVYPNPLAGNQLQVIYEGTIQPTDRVEVLDIFGSVLESYSLGTQMFLPMPPSRANGTYFVRLISEDGQKACPFVLSR
ncbi:MAG: T9SS type A sorting domain-containing protein [Bacteroidota bacterium]